MLNHKNDFELSHARHDAAHVLTPGLFRSLKKGERKKSKLDVEHKFGKESIRFIGFEPLGVFDMRLLQVVVALAGPIGLRLTDKPENKSSKKLRLLLKTKLDASEKEALEVEESFPRLLHEMGLTDGGPNIEALKDSLIRMSNVTVIIKAGSVQASSQLMSHYLNTETGRTLIAINYRLADAVLGGKGQQFAFIDLNETRALKSDIARFIHQRLCGWVDQGSTVKVSMNTLCSYVWIDDKNKEILRSTLSMRKKGVRKALGELIALNWSVKEYAKDKFEITRPKRG